MSRRLPVYLVLDCSESMAGGAIKAVKTGIDMMMSQLRSDPHALETVCLSVISFSYSAKVLVPLTDITLFTLPTITLGSGTALGSAITLLEERINSEVVRSTPERKGDYKPIVFFLTDGEPTDDWVGRADKFKRDFSAKRANVIAIACGEDASTKQLRRVTDNVILARDLESSTLKAVFQWVSSSVATASLAIDEKPGIRLEKSHELALATRNDDGRYIQTDRNLYLICRCIRDRAHYTLRFSRDESADGVCYVAEASNVIDHFDDTAAKDSADLRVSTSQLMGSSECPYCNNDLWAMCGCGRVHCCPSYDGSSISLTCPWCRQTSEYAFGTFEVGRGLG